MPFAQFNVARARWPLDDPRMAGFTDNISRINRLAERTPGYVWRLRDETSPEAPRFPDDPRMTFTLSVWRDVESLRHFTWSTVHKRFRLRTAEWFERPEAAYLAIWPIAEGHRPDGAEALAMLETLRAEGPSEAVFGTEAISESPGGDRRRDRPSSSSPPRTVDDASTTRLARPPLPKAGRSGGGRAETSAAARRGAQPERTTS